MADGFIQVPADSVGKQVDTAEIQVLGNTVERQRVVIGDNAGSALFATVVGSNPIGVENGLVVRNIPSGSQVITGIVNVSATASIIGTVNISGTAVVAGAISLAAGTANIGFLNNISATVTVAGAISLGAGTALIGAVSLAAGASNIGFINGISATVNVAFAGGISLAAGTANIGFINGISATVNTIVTAFLEKTTNSQVLVADSLNAAIRVNIVAGAAAGGTSIADRGVFTESTTQLTPAGGVFNETRTLVTEDQVAALRITNEAGLHVNLRDSSGNEISAGNALSVKVERVSATASVILAAGTANVGTVNGISATVLVAGVVSLAAGTSNIGFINNISATVVVSGTVSLGAGTALIGAISLAAGTSNIGFINNISATVTVAGTLSLAAGTANIGSINNISRTVVCGLAYVLDSTQNANQVYVGDSANTAIRVNIVADVFATAVTAIMSGSHGPKCVICSVSANTTLIVGPGAGLSIYVTQLMCNNGDSNSSVLCRVGTSASLVTIQTRMAPNGGGFVMNFDPPWKLSASEAALCSIKPGGANAFFNVNFYVAA